MSASATNRPQSGEQSPDPPLSLGLLGNTLLRKAIVNNLVSFPSQIQPFMKRTSGDLQSRVVLLFFVRGWSVRSICSRYSLSKAMAHKLLAEWRIRAVESGYIQEIQPGSLESVLVSGTKLEAGDHAYDGAELIQVSPVSNMAEHADFAVPVPPQALPHINKVPGLSAGGGR